MVMVAAVVLMEHEIFESLRDLSCSVLLNNVADLCLIIDEGSHNILFTKLVSWLSTELGSLRSLDESVHPINDPDDSNTFLLEVGSFLKECGCPYSTLIEGNVNQRLHTRDQRIQLLDFLCTELQAERIIASRAMDTASSSSTAELPSSNQATHLKNMLIALGFPKPPDSITPVQIFAKVEPRIEEQIKKLPNQNFGKPLFDGVLTAAQWKALNGLNEDMNAEYRMRAEMLLKRLDVTIQSFTWSDRLKKKEDELSRVYKRFRQTMTPDSTEISIADLLSARNDLTLVEKTCSGAVREKTKTKLNKVLMGRVPDRGGRPTEIEAPPPEMPPWMKREAPPQRGGGHRGGRGGYGQGGGPRVQGAGWQAGGGHGQPDWGHGGGGHAYAGFQGGQQQQSYGRGGGQQHYNSGQAYQQPHQQMYDQYGGGPGQGGYNQQGGGDYRRGGRGQRGGSGYR